MTTRRRLTVTVLRVTLAAASTVLTISALAIVLAPGIRRPWPAILAFVIGGVLTSAASITLTRIHNRDEETNR